MLSRILVMCLALTLTNGVPTVIVDATDEGNARLSLIILELISGVIVDATDEAPKKCSELAKRPPKPGAYIPQCDQDGNYLPKQCWASTGYCWCVDSTGKEISGTRKGPGQGNVYCEEAPKKCSELAKHPPIPGAYIPQCDQDGNYLPKQCWASTGYCWCVDSTGKEISGTRKGPGQGNVYCEEAPKKCSELAKHPPIPGAYIPQCDQDGNYLPKQCWASTGYCWCVDSTGKEISGTRKGPGQGNVYCEEAPNKCSELAKHPPIPGAYIPQCDQDGNYLPKQCWASTGYCWCVDSTGKEISGTRKGPGQGNVYCEEAPKKCSELAKRPPIPGAYIPQCDQDGTYLPKQCWASTGYCWCVDSTGKEISGTRKGPGQGNVHCEKAPKKCSEMVNRPPIPGAYIPQCDQDGNYLPKQCWASTGYCWCVDSTGKEINGTRKGPGQGNVHCEEAPKKCSELAKRPPKPGAYIPQCDQDGNYLPKQCWASTGYCWCVDSTGKEISGTRKGPGQGNVHCEEAPKKCSELAKRPPILGAYIPQCDQDGTYLPKQCWASTGYCWCVDSTGKEISGTRKGPGQGNVHCEKAPKKCSEMVNRPPKPGAYIPQCDQDGNYLPKQCWASTGYCWCVDSTGKEINGTSKGPGQGNVDCEEAPKKCSELAKHPPKPGAYIPQCDQDGNYLPKQCWASTGYCWCVDSTGKEISGTRKGPGQGNVHCEKAPKKCSELAKRPPKPGAYIPQCDQDGNYLPKQCWASTGYCWCVDSTGKEINGTRKGPGQGNVYCEEAPKKCSELAKHPPIPGAYIPQCDQDGNYLPKQCWASTGYCWCVDSTGKEISGTRKGPGQGNVHCEKAPKKCSELAKRPPKPGAYIPQCDQDGNYLPKQCWASTGYCWCVDSTGKEINGTRKGPGQGNVHCEEAPKKCSELAKRPPIPGAYIPQCDQDGNYLPKQCWASTGYCWCVDSTGKEINGTRKGPGQGNVHCEKGPVDTDVPPACLLDSSF
ncbi:thyroglobulin-like isoform X8 [Thalassophryne amazonica]|uniref:thyroglobulin-like isoform X8 n=1 Tax=Thalassophryne amazonica TaxID=390379 RepID=UPI001470E92C|nr:thyroglobulin-like isoform X8 [Thalassophryne amazonica]